MTALHRLGPLAVAALLALSACGGDDDAPAGNNTDDPNNGNGSPITSGEVTIELAWEHDDWHEDLDKNLDLDLLYCNHQTSLIDTTSHHCISWSNPSGDWEMGDDSYTVELWIDSRRPDEPEIVTHPVFSGGQTHIAVHYFDDQLDEPFHDVQANLTVQVDGNTVIDLDTTIGQPDDLWYVGTIDWPIDPSDGAYTPAPTCDDPADEACASSQGHYHGLPFEDLAPE